MSRYGARAYGIGMREMNTGLERVTSTLGPRGRAFHSGGVNNNVGLSAAESLQDAEGKIQTAHTQASNAQTVDDYATAAQSARDGASELSDLNPGNATVGSHAADADSQYHLIVDNVAAISISDANTAAVNAIAAADAALAAYVPPSPPRPPVPPVPVPPQQGPGLQVPGPSATVIGAIIVAAVAGGTAIWFGRKWLRRSRRR